MANKKPVIHTLESLREHLQAALAVELFTIPPYLCALYSIREGTNREAAAVIQSVVLEEMLHMALVANLINAVGGHATVNKPPIIPTYPDYLPHSARAFQISLGKFSPAAVEDFMKIEKPEEAGAPLNDDYFSSIGQFYEAVQHGLEYLVATEGEGKVFVGDAKLQITPEYYYGGAGEITLVRDTESAVEAIHEIVDQGEGKPGDPFEEEVRSAKMRQPGQPGEPRPGDGPEAGEAHHHHRHRKFSGEEEPAHYYRFQELSLGRYYQAGDTVKSGPTGPELPVQWDAVYDMRPNPKAAAYKAGSTIRAKLDAFNRSYMRLLDGLQRAFTGRQDELVGAVGVMYELKERAVELMRVPSGHGDTTVGPSFEYVPPE